MAQPRSSPAETSPSEGVRVWEKDGFLRFGIKAQPGAKREAVLGVWNGMLRVCVQTPPEAGRANEALLALLAKFLGLKKSQLVLASGPRSREKGIAVTGIDAPSLRRRIEEALP